MSVCKCLELHVLYKASISCALPVMSGELTCLNEHSRFYCVPSPPSSCHVKDHSMVLPFICAHHFGNRQLACCKYVQVLCKLLIDSGHVTGSSEYIQYSGTMSESG